MAKNQYETTKNRFAAEQSKLSSLYESVNPLRVTANYVTCRACGSKLNKDVMKDNNRRADAEIKCPVCGSKTGLYSASAVERIEKAKERLKKADKAFRVAEKEFEKAQKTAADPKKVYEAAIREAEDELEIVYDVYKGPDFTEIKGETGGDLRCIRVYKDGTSYEK